MSVAVFYPCRPYCTDKDVIEEILPNGVENLYPVINFPPQDSVLSKRAEFLSLLRDPSIETLMVWRGGRIEDDGNPWKSSFELLKNLTDEDWAEIKKHPKNIVGYSDATYLLCSLLSHGINCFYGPNYNATLQCSSEKELKATLEYLAQALESKVDYTINLNDEKLTAGGNEPWTFCGGTATGRLIGGNLDTIYNLLKMEEYASTFMPQHGDILFLEEIDPYYDGIENLEEKTVEKPAMSNIVGMLDKLKFLKKAGVFSKISGLLFGRSKEPNTNYADIVLPDDQISSNLAEKRYLEEYIRCIIPSSIPILANIACSHTHPMVTLPLGKIITMDATAQTLTVHEHE